MSDTQEKDSALQSSVLETKKTLSYQNSSLFKGNEAFLFIFKKGQKLASAIYLVTDLLPEEEKIRQDLRLLSVSFIKDILTAVSSGHNSMSSVRVVEIISLLEIASSARLISAMNANVLKSEYEQILYVLNQNQNQASVSSVVLTEDLLKTDVPMPEKRSSSVPSLSGPAFLPTSFPPFTPIPHPIEIPTSRRNYIGQDKGQESSVTKERSLSILELIKKTQQPLSIKDITTHIRGVGEKTIQRELGAMVAKGVLKREGERRWSRYSLR